MPRNARIDYEGCYHHVMGRGIDGLKIFNRREDKEDFLTRLKELQKKSSIGVNRGMELEKRNGVMDRLIKIK